MPVPALLAVTVSPATDGTLRPRKRPDVLLASAPVEAAPADEPARGGGLGALFGNRKPKKPVPTDGYVCGDPDIRGDELAPITSKVKGCGVEEPVRVTSIDGIRLRGGATIDCNTATALKTWIDKGMQPAFSKDVVELQIAGSYVCRPRNNIRGNKISEHGRGKAVDISAFVFSDGSEWTVKSDYNRQIRKAHKAACGIFGTTLGPGSDGYHEDHLHFDTAGYRNGPYCR
ncbi:extensin family protein [Paragemmobacter straminiformis]|uniref:Extensin family protein n=1 Tax=Paragemmobacter straminiformis TaxID=2045119 RepID=A0A842I5F2_9RHOB|nr:extensin family protein [Gemmobacter straminiformis]MBC2834889.1 extensin family protein [Gemmobacter straminiformis]